MVQAEDVSVNGYMVSPVFSVEIQPGKKALSNLTFFSQDLEDNGITAIEELELSFHIYDGDQWKLLYTTDPATVTWQ